MKQYNLGIEATLEIIGGKWKALIICFLMSGAKRTSELQRNIQGISQKVLIQQLRELERDGLVKRFVYQQMPPKLNTASRNMALQPIRSWMLCVLGEKKI